MQLFWKTPGSPLTVLNTQMAEFEITDIVCTAENVSYSAGKYLLAILDIKTQERFQ